MLISAIVGVGLRSGVALATANPATWNGNSGTSSSWGDVANWNGTNGNPDGGGTGVVHFAGSNRLTPNNDYGAFTQFNQIQFDSGASSFQLNGNVIKLFGSGTVAKVENNSANAQTVNFLDGSNRSILMESAIELDPTGGDLTINGGILADFNSGQISVFGGGGHTLTLNGSFTQNAPTGSIVNQTNNTIVLNANNSYTGDTQILAGKLQFGLNGKADSSTIRLGATGGSANAELDLLSTTGGQTIGSVVNPRAITSGIITVASQNTSGTNTFFGHFGLDHALTITQSGGGTLVFNQAHTDGATAKTGMDIKGFTVTFAGPGAAGGIINVSGDIYSSTGSTGNVIIGSASSTPVSVTLSGINTYSGTTTLNSGSTLNINSASALSTGVLTIGGGCTIDNASAGNITLSNNNALTLSGGSLTFTGTHDLNFGTGTVTISGAASRTITTTAGTLTFGGSVTDAGSGRQLTKAGAGTLVLSAAANNWTGGVEIDNGLLQFGNKAALGSGTITLSASGGTATLQPTGDFSGANKLANAFTVAGSNTASVIGGSNNLEIGGSVVLSSGGSRTLTVNSSGLTTFSGGTVLTNNDTSGRTATIAGSGNLIISGAITNNSAGTTVNATGFTYSGSGSLTLSNVNGYTGTTTVSSGTVVAASNAALGTTTNGTTVSSGATLGFQGAITYSTAEAVSLNGSGDATNSRAGAIDNISGANSFAGAITMAGASTIGATAGSLTLNGGISNGGNLLTVAGAGNVTVSTNRISGGGGLTKNNGGTLTLNVASTYGGNTTINGGTLLANTTDTTNGSTGSGTVNINNTAKLGGSGVVIGAVNVNTGGTISAGNATTNGTLTTGAQNWADGAIYNWKASGGNPNNVGSAVAGTDWDLLFSTSSITLSPTGTFTINITNNNFASFDHTKPYTWKIAQGTGNNSIVNFDASHFTLNTSGFTLSGGDFFSIAESNNNSEIDITYVPEPASAGLLTIAAIGMLGRRSRRSVMRDA